MAWSSRVRASIGRTHVRTAAQVRAQVQRLVQVPVPVLVPEVLTVVPAATPVQTPAAHRALARRPEPPPARHQRQVRSSPQGSPRHGDLWMEHCCVLGCCLACRYVPHPHLRARCALSVGTAGESATTVVESPASAPTLVCRSRDRSRRSLCDRSIASSTTGTRAATGSTTATSWAGCTAGGTGQCICGNHPPGR